MWCVTLYAHLKGCILAFKVALAGGGCRPQGSVWEGLKDAEKAQMKSISNDGESSINYTSP